MTSPHQIKASLGLAAGLALSVIWWAQRGGSVRAGAGRVSAASPTANAGRGAPGGGLTGRVGAGASQLLLARAQGRVKKIFFTGGEYVHRGDVLVKLVNYSFVVAPRSGFLGRVLVYPGQYLTATTPVTTLSEKDHLVVVVPPLPHAPALQPGDSVRVWVASRPDRVVTGIIGPAPDPGAPAVEIQLGPGAPFRIGEQARLSSFSPALAADLPPR